MAGNGTKKDLHRSLKIGEGPAFKNAFNLHAALANVKDEFPPSPISEIYQNPTLTGGSGGIYPHLSKGIFSKHTLRNSSKLNSFELISIDKIAILFACPLQTYKPFWNAFKKIIEFGRPEILP